jgi:hypothetical protein
VAELVGENAGELAGVEAGDEGQADGEDQIAFEDAPGAVGEAGGGVDVHVDVDAGGLGGADGFAE